jgi:hypothetical protein
VTGRATFRSRTLRSARTVAKAPGVRFVRAGAAAMLSTVAGMASHRPSASTYPCKVTRKQIEGAAGPLRGLGALAIPEQAAGVMGLAPAALHSPPHSDGDGLPPVELVRRYRGASPGRMMAPSRRCQGVKCLCTGAGARVRGALERGGACSRGRGSSSEAEPARGKRIPSNGTEPAQGRRASSSEAKPARGDL